MAKAEYLGLDAVGWKYMIKNWWNLVLAFLALFGVVSGLIYVSVVLYLRYRKSREARSDRSKELPKATIRYFEELKANTQPFGPDLDTTKAPTSLGVFLGAFSSPPTANQARLLSVYDLLVCDPLQPGVLDALSSSELRSKQAVGRLDVAAVVAFDRSSGNHDDSRIFSILDQTIATKFRRNDQQQSPFTGILLANWQADISSLALNSLVSYLKGLQFDCWLEAAPPAYLTPNECADIDLSLIRGIVCRNGTILSHGDRRDYFQMSDMRRTQRALAKHMSLGGKTLAMWETVEDQADLAHSVIMRSYNWCRFNTTISWIGTESALVDADVAAEKTIPGQPLGALMWLKSNEIMAAHTTWRQNDRVQPTAVGSGIAYKALEKWIPDLASRLEIAPSHDPFRDGREGSQIILNGDFDGPIPAQTQKAAFSYSPRGEDYTGLGCFQTGLDFSAEDAAELTEGQRRLRDLELLERLRPEQLGEFARQLTILYEDQSSWEHSPYDSQAVRELVEQLECAVGTENDVLKVFVGLHTGFHKGTDKQAFGLADVDPHTGATEIYLSGRASDRVNTILHTFLSSRQYTRAQCFMAEMALGEKRKTLHERWSLPQRIVKDVEGLSSTELMLFMQRLVFTKDEGVADFRTKVQALCEHRLLDIPTLSQLREQNTSKYIRGEITPEAIISSRVSWYRERGCHHPDPAAAVELFYQVESLLKVLLVGQQAEFITTLETVLLDVLRENAIDARADVFALAIFCAFRKLAIEEIYLEVLDRNPLPNLHAHPDQEACFAEMFALGSQCETYLDMTSNVLGLILANKMHAYYMVNQPPIRDDKTTETPTAYASTLVDEDPSSGAKTPVAWYWQVSFLGIFAVPALIDILLLTTIGRGLYLSTYMADVEKTMATAGLMFGLLGVGAIGTWIGHGGSYYLHSMAFPAMNMFVLTRFSAGMAVWLVVGLGGLIVLGIIRSFYAGFIFFFYLMVMSCYLTLLATLAVYQFPSFTFQSGRVTVLSCLPLLAISPILTLWIGHDIIVYPCVLTGFLVSLILGSRGVLYRWGTWHLKLDLPSDSDIVEWYIKTTPAGELPKGVVDLGPTPLPRTKVLAEVKKELAKKPWQKPTTDPMIKQLADNYEATCFLLHWYTMYSRTSFPYEYSPTWNLQCKTAIDTLKEMQKGLKLHNAFIHWRWGGNEVWCGVLYFIIALMDKWVALLSGGSVVGLSAADSDDFRLPVGFGLAYYLIAAVCLDSVATPLWARANKKTNQPITSLAYLRQATINDAAARRKLYWTNWAKFFFTHTWGLACASSALWTFQNNRDATIMFLAYTGSYTGLLCYQYNRIYTGSLAMVDLMIAALAGLLLGPLLHRYQPGYPYNAVTALAVSTWMAALLSIRTAKVGWPSFKKQKSAPKPTVPTYYYSALGPDATYSQRTLSETYDALSALDDEFVFRMKPETHPGVEVMQILKARATASNPEPVDTAFPNAAQLIRETISMWQSGNIVIDLVPARHFLQQEQKLRAVSRVSDGQLCVKVLVGLDIAGSEWVADIHRNCCVIAESLIQSTVGARFALSNDHANLAELLAVEYQGEDELALPEGVKRQLEWSATERGRIGKNGEKEVLRYLILGLDCDTEWDRLPEGIRTALLKRCLGEQCDITTDHADYFLETVCKDSGIDLETHFARSNLGATVATMVTNYAKALDAEHSYQVRSEPSDSEYQKFIGAATSEAGPDDSSSLLERLRWPLMRLVMNFRFVVKFFVISITADPEFQRELDYVISRKSIFIRWPARIVLNGIWNYAKLMQHLILPQFLFYRRGKVQALRNNMKGVRTTIMKKKVVIDGLKGSSTGFLKPTEQGEVDFYHYSGCHEAEPQGLAELMAINTYSIGMVLRRREEYSKQAVSNVYQYVYEDGAQTDQRLPVARECIKGDRAGHTVQYDDRGYMTNGSYMKDGNVVDFRLHYRSKARFDDELLRAEFELAHIKMQVSWCVPPPKKSEKPGKWVPNPKVIEASFTQGEDTYRSKWEYEHRSHPIIITTLNGRPSETPDMITYDWFNVLKKPTNCSFAADNPLLSFKSPNTNIISRALGLNTKVSPVSTALARTHLWQTWKAGKDLDAVILRYLDESAMRADAVLRPYWAGRDLGQMRAAADFLESQAGAIMARTDMDPEISSWTSIAYKYSDLCTFGQGGDSRINTRTQDSQLIDSDDTLHILAMDTGTWPIEGGGVSACRRDMVNDLRTIRWHVVAESANDYAVPKFQIERNVQSISILPLWGMDGLTPIHGIFQDSLDSAVQRLSHATRDEDIVRHFIPILTTIVKCSRAIKFTHAHIEEASRALVDLNAYFETRHWTDIWTSDVVKQKWYELWLAEDVENARPISTWLDAECPTFLHLDNALDMWSRYLFIFSLPVPERIPDVFQASHHFAGAAFGVLCKLKRSCSFHVWDHCISWREVTVFLSSAMSFDSPFVCTSLMSLSRMTSCLILHYADVVLPCAATFNPGWEVELGSQQGTLCHRNTYARKIDPVVNGITGLEKFKPIEEVKTKKPTVVMLSHVRFVKDIKNAILAADIIVNEWGFKDYQLDIYGDMEKAPAYSVECKEILASKGLREHVTLKGLGNPTKVLEDAWLFLNSSVSEGLPLAMGEAALFGVPVVCTDVGASFAVVTDCDSGVKLSGVVAPNDSYSLARAQVNVLGMLDEWAMYTDEPDIKPKLSLTPTKDEVSKIQQRMYDKAEYRRKLGMLGRDNCLRAFNGKRYLRQHEEMLWLGKLQSPSYLARSRRAVPIISKWALKRESASPSLLARSGRSTPRPMSSRAPSAYSFLLEPKPAAAPKYHSISAHEMV